MDLKETVRDLITKIENLDEAKKKKDNDKDKDKEGTLDPVKSDQLDNDDVEDREDDDLDNDDDTDSSDEYLHKRRKAIKGAIQKARLKEQALDEEVENLDEISDNLKRKYLDKAVQDRYNWFTGRDKYEIDPSDKSKFTPTGKIKKSWRNSKEYKRGLEKHDRRTDIIDKTSTELTGKPHYNNMSAEKGNAADWWKGKKYSKEEYNSEGEE